MPYLNNNPLQKSVPEGISRYSLQEYTFELIQNHFEIMV